MCEGVYDSIYYFSMSNGVLAIDNEETTSLEIRKLMKSIVDIEESNFLLMSRTSKRYRHEELFFSQTNNEASRNSSAIATSYM